MLRAEGRDTRGQGNAIATITATLAPEGDGTKVTVLTDLTVTGKVAQFGRGVLADVSAKLLDQFVAGLEADVLVRLGTPPPRSERRGRRRRAPPTSPGAADAGRRRRGRLAARRHAPSTTAAAVAGAAGARRRRAARKIDSKPAEPVDLLGTAGSPVAKRVGPVVGVLVVVSCWLLRRRRKRDDRQSTAGRRAARPAARRATSRSSCATPPARRS